MLHLRVLGDIGLSWRRNFECFWAVKCDAVQLSEGTVGGRRTIHRHICKADVVTIFVKSGMYLQSNMLATRQATMAPPQPTMRVAPAILRVVPCVPLAWSQKDHPRYSYVVGGADDS